MNDKFSKLLNLTNNKEDIYKKLISLLSLRDLDYIWNEVRSNPEVEKGVRLYWCRKLVNVDTDQVKVLGYTMAAITSVFFVSGVSRGADETDEEYKERLSRSQIHPQ